MLIKNARVRLMARKAREKSNTGVYHIMMRGTGRQEIFFDDEDNMRFLDRLNTCKKNNGIEVYGWCLMGNHVHFLIREGPEGVSKTVQRLGISYAGFFNWKYHTVGHLFQDRFKSEKVETDGYLLTVVRYIHQNPVKANIAKNILEYEWSSCRGYYGKPCYPAGMLNTAPVLEMFGEDEERAKKGFILFNEQENDDRCLDETVRRRLTDEEAVEEIKNVVKGHEIPEVKSLPESRRRAILREIKNIDGITLRQAGRLLGISHVMIHNAK